MKILSLKSKIMLDIYAIYLMRRLRTTFMLETLILVFLALVLPLFVSVPNVLSNMLDSTDFIHYFITAFSSTTLVVQVIVILSTMTMLLLVKNITIQAFSRQKFT